MTGDIGKGSPWRGGRGRGGGGRPTVRCLYERAVRTTCQERQTERERERQRTREGQSPPPWPQGLTRPQGWPWMSKLPFARVHIQQSWAIASSHQDSHQQQPRTARSLPHTASLCAAHTPGQPVPTIEPRHRPSTHRGKHSGQQKGALGEAEAARRIPTGKMGAGSRASSPHMHHSPQAGLGFNPSRATPFPTARGRLRPCQSCPDGL